MLEVRGIEASQVTIWREIKRLGYSNMDKQKEIELTEEDKQNRVDWCLRNVGRDWSMVIFSDESGIDNQVRR